MTDAGDHAQVRVKGKPIGCASGLAIRFIFLREIDWAPPNQKLKGIERIEDREMKLHDLARIMEKEKYAKPLFDPIFSFYSDVTLNEEGARRLPIVAACAAPVGGLISENIVNFAPPLRVQIPGEIPSDWEGEVVKTRIVENLSPADETASPAKPLPPLEITCNFVDTMAFFASGHVAYAVSLIFRADSFPNTDAQKIPIFPTVILSLLNMARSSDGNFTRANTKFGFVGDPIGLTPMDEFISRRLQSLANASAVNQGFRATPHDASKYCDIFRGIIWPTRRSKQWLRPKDGDEKEFASFKFNDLQSATCEIVEFSEFDRLQIYVADAKEYRAQVDFFGKSIAGLAQNVIDFEDQDPAEVSDSLFYAMNVAGCTHFVNAKAIVVFYERSRAFDRMQNFIGGEPYFYFTALATLYNEFLTNRAAAALSELKPGMLIEADPLEATKFELESRYRIFVGYLRPMIPNLFRYNAESVLFNQINARRGITERRETIEKELSRYETIAHDFEGLNLQRSNSQFNILVVILALWSAFGALVTAASLFVALHSDAQPERIAETAVEFSKNSAERFMEVSFWIALIGLTVAATVSSIFLVKILSRMVRQSVAGREKRYRAGSAYGKGEQPPTGLF